MEPQVTEMRNLEKLRAPFPAHQISLLPKPTSKDAKKGRCAECGGWHGLPAVHLSYVGHAALTDRLLDTDPTWNWEPLAIGPEGLPVLDVVGGMWIKLTVCGVTRLGYGHAGDKQGGDAIKEIIGDALRNAAMRFGAALDLWHKGDLHGPEEEAKEEPKGVVAAVLETGPKLDAETVQYLDALAIDVAFQFKQNGQASAFDRVEVEGLDADQKTYLWHNLDSKTRTALKIEGGLRTGKG